MPLMLLCLLCAPHACRLLLLLQWLEPSHWQRAAHNDATGQLRVLAIAASTCKFTCLRKAADVVKVYLNPGVAASGTSRWHQLGSRSEGVGTGLPAFTQHEAGLGELLLREHQST